MNEKRTFKKRLTGLFAMTLVLIMITGMTVNAEGIAYYIYPDGELGGLEGERYCYTLCSDSDCKIPVTGTLSEGDTVNVTYGSGYLRVFVDGNEDGSIRNSYVPYTIPGGTYDFSIGKEDSATAVLNLTSYVPPVTENSEEKSESGCNHGKLEPKLIREATEIEDSMISWFCTSCGNKVSEEVLRNTAYACFLKNAINKINNAEAGSTVEITSELWNTLKQDVMLALAARRDINVVLYLTYQNVDYQYTIPAGAAIPTEDEFYGPLYLGQFFEMTKVEQ